MLSWPVGSGPSSSGGGIKLAPLRLNEDDARSDTSGDGMVRIGNRGGIGKEQLLQKDGDGFGTRSRRSAGREELSIGRLTE